MGRISKEKADNIEDYLSQGYTIKEVAKKAKCSESTVQRIKSRKQSTKFKDDSVKELMLVNTRAVLDTFNNMLFYWEFEEFRAEIPNIVQERLLEYISDMFRIDSQFAKTVLNKSEYYQSISAFLNVDQKHLSLTSNKLRRKWINLLKKHAPEKLADLIKI